MRISYLCKIYEANRGDKKKLKELKKKKKHF